MVRTCALWQDDTGVTAPIKQYQDQANIKHKTRRASLRRRVLFGYLNEGCLFFAGLAATYSSAS